MQNPGEKLPWRDRFNAWLNRFVFGDDAGRQRIAAVFFGLLLIWIVFITLTVWAQVEAYAALILILVSLAALILARFPQIVDRIKSVKLWDVTIDLKEVAQKSELDVLSGALSAVDIKRGLHDLAQVLVNWSKSRAEQQVLVVHTPERDSLVTPRDLLTYVVALEAVRPCRLAVLFVATPRRGLNGILSTILAQDIIGAVSGDTLQASLVEFYDSHVEYEEYVRRIQKAIADARLEASSESGVDGIDALRNNLSSLYQRFSHQQGRQNEPLSLVDVQGAFRKQLSIQMVQQELSPMDQQTVRDAIVRDHEYILVLDGETLHAVAPTGEVAKVVLEKLLARINTAK